MAETKKEIRKEIKRLRADHSDEWIAAESLAAAGILTGLLEYRDAPVVLAYVDCKHEVGTSAIIEAALRDGKRVAVPKVAGKVMNFFYISSLENDLEDGYYGIREPVEGLAPADGDADTEGSIIIMPGVAFDESRHRVGYGGGFYDRYLEAHKTLKTVALAFEFQIRDEVPFEEFDILPEKIVTEKRVIS